MPLPSTYAEQNCSAARALEIVGERWTLLIIRNAFYGVRSFGDFVAQLGIPRAVLTTRLKLLVDEGVLTRDRASDGGVDYQLTDKGVALWPVLRALMNWGDDYYSPAGVRRSAFHDPDDGAIGADGRCVTCAAAVPVAEIRLEPGPGFVAARAGTSRIAAAINTPRRLLEPIRTS
jgi:DNA-binding HxlR family transcriptional regulator